MNFFGELVRPAKDMAIVLGKSPDPHEPVQGACPLIPINSTQLAPAHRKFPVTAYPGVVDRYVKGAVHWS